MRVVEKYPYGRLVHVLPACCRCEFLKNVMQDNESVVSFVPFRPLDLEVSNLQSGLFESIYI